MKVLFLIQPALTRWPPGWIPACFTVFGTYIYRILYANIQLHRTLALMHKSLQLKRKLLKAKVDIFVSSLVTNTFSIQLLKN